jgi:hypothetical protein
LDGFSLSGYAPFPANITGKYRHLVLVLALKNSGIGFCSFSLESAGTK